MTLQELEALVTSIDDVFFVVGAAILGIELLKLLF